VHNRVETYTYLVINLLLLCISSLPHRRLWLPPHIHVANSSTPRSINSSSKLQHKLPCTAAAAAASCCANP
jgi:hypothetical protein